VSKPSVDETTHDIEQLHTAVVLAGHTGDEMFVRSHIDHPEGRIRASALMALQRLGCLDVDTLNTYLRDRDPAVRRKVAELAAQHEDFDILPLLSDDDSLVVEMAAWACGERGPNPDDIDGDSYDDNPQADDRIIARLIELTTSHDDPLVRESAVAALGALGDERGVPAILQACTDKPAIRRRAVLALAPFTGSDVDAALRSALEDRDWQVRQAAEDVLGPERAD
jgi:HEAT repeat protein